MKKSHVDDNVMCHMKKQTFCIVEETHHAFVLWLEQPGAELVTCVRAFEAALTLTATFALFAVITNLQI